MLENGDTLSWWMIVLAVLAILGVLGGALYFVKGLREGSRKQGLRGLMFWRRDSATRAVDRRGSLAD